MAAVSLSRTAGVAGPAVAR